MRIRPVWMVTFLLLAMALAVPGTTDGKGKNLTPLAGQIDYWFVGHLGETDDEGRTLIWEATITGDIDGTMKWWFGPSPATGGPFEGGRVGFYAGRWEIWDSDGKKLLLAGESAGKTVTLGGADGMWDGHGRVTDARRGLSPLKGRTIYETGPVSGTFPDLYGTGMFYIY